MHRGYSFTGDAERIRDGDFWWVTYASAAGREFTTTLPRLGDYLQSDGTVTVLFSPEPTGPTSRTLPLTSSENLSHPGPELTYATVPRGTVFIVQ